MPIRVEPNDDARREAVRRLVGAAVAPSEVEGRVELHQPDADEPRLRRSLVAVAGDGSVVGVGTATGSARHPVFHHVAVDLHPAHRDGPAGRLLLDGLAAAMAAAGVRRRWMAVVDAGDEANARLLAGSGFRHVVTSKTGRVGLAAVTSSPPAPVPDMVEVGAMEWSDDVAALYEELYDEAHWWTPYVRFARGVPWVRFVGDPVPGTAFVARDLLDRPIAVTSVHVGGAVPGAPMLAPTLVRHGARRPDAAAVLAALVDRTLAATAAALPGEAWVAWEVDDTAPELGAALGRFPLEVGRVIEAWTTPRLPTLP